MAEPLLPPLAAGQRYLGLDELRPSVELAGKWYDDRHLVHEYRVPAFHMILIEEGRIAARTPYGSFHATAGDLVSFWPAQNNRYETFKGLALYQVHLQFAPPPHHRLAPALGEAGPLPMRISMGEKFDDARRLFEVFCIELEQPGAVPRLRIASGVLELLAIVAGLHRPRADRPAPLDSWQRALLQLESRFDSPPSIDAIARQMGVTAGHFSRNFKQRFGVSPNAHRMRARLRQAARLLQDTATPVKTIAYSLGFDDPRSFARAFRRHLGVKPSDLRGSSGPNAAIAPHPRPRPRGDLFRANHHILPPGSDFFAQMNRYYEGHPHPPPPPLATEK